VKNNCKLFLLCALAAAAVSCGSVRVRYVPANDRIIVVPPHTVLTNGPARQWLVPDAILSDLLHHYRRP